MSPTSTAVLSSTPRHSVSRRSDARRPPTDASCWSTWATESPSRLELTWLRDHAATPYELGENESHLCMRVTGDYDAVREYHRQMGCVCFENLEMGLYFINDPDDYWIEILPLK